MVNWPFVWAQAHTEGRGGHARAVGARRLRLGAATRGSTRTRRRRRRSAASTSASRRFSKHVDFAYQATECITSDENQADYMITNGNPASSAAVYDDPDVRRTTRWPTTIRESLEAAAPRPLSPYYSEITGVCSASTTRRGGRSPSPPASRP